MHNLPRGDSPREQQRLTEFVPSILAYWDADLRCRFASRAFEHGFGVSPASLVGTSLRDLLGPELFTQNEAHVRAALNGHARTLERVAPGPVARAVIDPASARGRAQCGP